jgi:hypothetical protein
MNSTLPWKWSVNTQCLDDTVHFCSAITNTAVTCLVQLQKEKIKRMFTVLLVIDVYFCKVKGFIFLYLARFASDTQAGFIRNMSVFFT